MQMHKGGCKPRYHLDSQQPHDCCLTKYQHTSALWWALPSQTTYRLRGSKTMFSQALSVPHSTNRGSLDSRFWLTLLFIALFFEIVALILPQAQAFRQFIFFTNFQRPFSGNQTYCMISPACKAHSPPLRENVWAQKMEAASFRF